LTADVALTFDNGPAAGVTDTVLDVLRDRDVLATFFVVGRQLDAPGALDLLRRAFDEGHRVGNHTWSHSVAFGDLADEDTMAEEIDRTQALISPFEGAERLFRPFGSGGIIDEHLLSAVAARHLEAGGYTCVLWDCVPRDWEDPSGWPERCLAEIEGRDHSVVVLHDLPTGAMDALPRFLDALEERAVRCVQEFPDHCVALRRGRPTDVLDALIETDPQRSEP
jgi:peptidoglycan-N-acetylglucosamine deacetylase